MSNLINIICIAVLAYFIATDPVDETLRSAAWVLLLLIIIYTVVKFYLPRRKK